MADMEIKATLTSFEAKGPEDAVRSEFATWREWSGATPQPRQPVAAAVVPGAVPEGAHPLPVSEVTPPVPNGNGGTTGLDRLYTVDGELITLTHTPQGEQQKGIAFMLLMLGYLRMLRMTHVSGTRLAMSLKQTGIPGIERVDVIASPYVLSAHVSRAGVRKGVKYNLTVTGVAEAEKMAKALLETMPDPAAA